MPAKGMMRQIGAKISNQDTKFYIWGAGMLAEKFLLQFKEKIQVLGFLDGDLEKQKELNCGYPVVDPSTLKKEDDVVVIVAAYLHEDSIFPKLEEMGYEKLKSAISVLDFPAVYGFYKEEKLNFSHIPYCITDVCTLRCKYCSGLSSYIPDPQHHSLEVILNDFERIFAYVDYVDRISITDGDPMTHPDFIQIMDAIGERYVGTRTNEFYLYVNSVLLPTEEQLELFRKHDVTVHVTDYGKYVAHLQKLDEMIEILQKAGVKCIIDQSAKNNISWYDTGYPQTTNGRSPDGVKELYRQCVQKRHCHLEFEKMMICGVALYTHKAKHTELQPGDYFDLTEFDATRKEEMLEFYLGYVENGCLTNCKKCNGYGQVNKTAVPMGLQREQEETEV